MDLDAGPLMAVGHAVQRLRAGREDTLVEAHPPQRCNPWRHDSFSARLVSREPRAIDEDDRMAASGEEERGRRPARPRAHHDHIGLDHGGHSRRTRPFQAYRSGPRTGDAGGMMGR